MENIDRILKALQTANPDVDGSALIDTDGSILSYFLPESLEQSKIKEMTEALFSLGEDIAQPLKRGTVDKIFLKGEEGYIVFTGIRRKGVLTVLASKNARLGLLFSDIEETSKQLERILREINPDIKNILVIDDERPFLSILSNGLMDYDDDFNILNALNGKEAVEILNATKVDVVVTDLKMPVMDGFELLAYMSKNSKDIPVIVMTAYSTPEVAERLQNLGAFQYFEKPMELNILADKILEALEATTSQDHIHGISLVGFLQLIEMEKKTCTLTIKSRGKVGHLYFARGDLMEAETGNLRGESAALDITTWDTVEIEIKYICRIKKKAINLPLPEILIEGYRRMDERNGVCETPGGNSRGIIGTA